MKEVEFSVPNYNFKGKAFLVTGSTRGIGLTTALKLVTYGAIVGIHGSKNKSVKNAIEIILKQQSKAELIPLIANFLNPMEAEEIVKKFYHSTGRIDGLVNNAGSGLPKIFRAITLEQWRNTFAINLESHFVACKTAYELMRKQKYGSIVNVASVAGETSGGFMGADYAASKAGIISITKTLAAEAARFNIRVNAVSPGYIETDMTSILTEEMKKNLRIPLQRLGKTDEVASVIIFLLSDAASYITGQIIRVDGGLKI